MLAIKVGGKYVPVSDALMATILAHASANVAYGKAKRSEYTAVSKAAHQAECDLFDAIAVYVDALVLDALDPEARREAIIENLIDKFRGMPLRDLFEHLYADATREPCERCEVELEATYPGILYRKDDPTWPADTAMRCDICERYDSDLQARQALHRLTMDDTGEVFYCWRCDEQHWWQERMAAIHERGSDEEHCIHARCVVPGDLVLEFIDPDQTSIVQETSAG